MTAKADPFADWYDISSEQYREYVSENGFIYRIEKPLKFKPNRVSGTHYVLTADGVVHTLVASAFMVCRFLDDNGVSFTTTQDGDTTRS